MVVQSIHQAGCLSDQLELYTLTVCVPQPEAGPSSDELHVIDYRDFQIASASAQSLC